MKNFILILTLALTYFGNAQIDKKSWLIGGNAIAGTGNVAGTHISISPNLGYFVSKRFCPGISTTARYSKMDNINTFSLSLVIFSRVYFGIREKSSFYGMAALDLAPLFNKGNVAPSIGLGHVWFINKNVGFESQLAFLSFQNKYNIGLRFGLQIYLNRNKAKIE